MTYKSVVTVFEYSTVAFLFLAIIYGSSIDGTFSFVGGVSFQEIISDSEIQRTIFACITAWCVGFVVLTFGLKDISLVCLLFIASFTYVVDFVKATQNTDATTLLGGVALGRGVSFLWSRQHQCFLISCLILMLATSSWCHINLVAIPYHGPRWMGLWNNPNIYGMLMGAGVVLSAGLLADRKWKTEGGGRRTEDCVQTRGFFWFGAAMKSAICQPPTAILVLAIGMMAVGLVMSYSRGAWCGTAAALLYLAWSCGKLKWKYVALGVGLLALGVLCLWGRTTDNAPWYVKRMDFGRPSAQHRVAAWRGALQMMWDHPFGVGWNRAVEIYAKDYSPPEGGSTAIMTNDYLMLGTELGLPGLLCFVSYVALQLGVGRRKLEVAEKFRISNSEFRIKTACRAGALVFAVAFWFDGGLFTLATAAVFWVVLELGKEPRFKPRMDTEEHGFSKKELAERQQHDRTALSPDSVEQSFILAHPCASAVQFLSGNPETRKTAQKPHGFMGSLLRIPIRVHPCASVVKEL